MNEINVNSGEVGACEGKGILRASAIGSCVVVTAYDTASRVGAMAHVMLPGMSKDKDSTKKLRYAEDAIEEMMLRVNSLGADRARLIVCLVGGGNVLGPTHDSPGPDIVRSLIMILGKLDMKVNAMEVGGIQRRSCSLELANGRVTYTIGDSSKQTLWNRNANSIETEIPNSEAIVEPLNETHE